MCDCQRLFFLLIILSNLEKTTELYLYNTKSYQSPLWICFPPRTPELLLSVFLWYVPCLLLTPFLCLMCPFSSFWHSFFLLDFDLWEFLLCIFLNGDSNETLGKIKADLNFVWFASALWNWIFLHFSGSCLSLGAEFTDCCYPARQHMCFWSTQRWWNYLNWVINRANRFYMSSWPSQSHHC